MNVRGVAVVAMMATGACSLLTRLDDLGSGADTGVDGLVGADAADGALPGDASTGDAAACTSSATSFCDNFDNGPLGATWTGIQVSGGTVILDNNAVSPPHSMRSTLNAGDAGNAAALTKDFPSATTITCAFDMFVDTTSSAERAQLISLLVGATDVAWQGYRLDVYINSDGTSLIEEWGIYPDGGSFITDGPFGAIAKQKWVHVELDFQYGGTAHVYIDGSPVGGIAMAKQSPQKETFFLGMRAGGLGPWAVLFDNLVCTF